MKREFITRYSNELGQDMSVLVFGHAGYPVVVFPTQDAMAGNWEDFGMVDTLADYLDDGKIQLFCVDSVDAQSWSLTHGNKEARADRQEAYFSYVCHELVPFVHEVNGSELRPLATGCSMGATHAALAILRRPDLFQGCIALSGVYRTSFFFGNWMNGALYENDAPQFLQNMPADHPYVDLYNQRQIVLCVGQGAWEDGIDDLRSIAASFDRLGVSAWCDFWGTDVNHDWPWWKKQIRYFLPEVLADIERQGTSEAPAADAEPEPEAEPAPEPEPEPVPEPQPVKKAEPKPAPAPVKEKTVAKPKATKKAKAKAPAKKAAKAKAEPKPAPAKPAKKAAAAKPAAKATTKAKAPAKPKAPSADDLQKLTVTQLRDQAKKLGIAGSKLRKADLVQAILRAQA